MQFTGFVGSCELGQRPNPIPKTGRSGLRMKELVDGGAEPPIQSSKFERKKDKGKGQVLNTHIGKDGEGMSGSSKETKVKGENKRAGKCLPKSKMVPKL